MAVVDPNEPSLKPLVPVVVPKLRPGWVVAPNVEPVVEVPNVRPACVLVPGFAVEPNDSPPEAWVVFRPPN